MRCPSCKIDVTPVPPRTMAKMAVVVLYVAMLLVATSFSLLLGLNLVLAPVAIVLGFSIGTMTRRANAWSCPLCKEELFVPYTLIAPQPEATAAPPLVTKPA